MTTMTINIENPSIVPSLKKILSALDGVTIEKTKVTRAATSAKSAVDIPNDLTIAAMKDAENGVDAGDVNLESVDSFIASMM